MAKKVDASVESVEVKATEVTTVPSKAFRSLQDRFQRYDLGVCGTAEVMMALRAFFKEVQKDA
jgi:hypothetical protein